MSLLDAKTNMIKQQLRTDEVTDEGVLHLFATIDRAAFVDPDQQDLAYADMMLPMSCKQFMLSPLDQAKMLQALNIEPHETVLEIGTGNGFFTALLAKRASQVISVEIHEALLHEAEQHLQRLHINNVSLQLGNGANGWKVKAPVDVLVITGSLPFLPKTFKSCIKEHGRILAILGEQTAAMQMILMNARQAIPLFETQVPQLEKAIQGEQFVF
jgi:protein-L-isoaspartate(D-aspartate) O-methyltransferase